VRFIQTTIGATGNRYEDVAFLWISTGTTAPAAGRAGHVDLGREIGLHLKDFVELSSGHASMRSFFESALLASPRTPMASELVAAALEMSRTLDAPDAKKSFASEFSRWISGGNSRGFNEMLGSHDEELASATSIQLEHSINAAFDGETIVVEHSPPSVESIMALLSRGSGVALGAYVGYDAASNVSPLLLYASVPAGMLICGTAAGVADALQRGLRHRVLAWLVGASQRQTRAAAWRALESAFPNTVETLNAGKPPRSGSGEA
jgi:hypothetical protein